MLLAQSNRHIPISQEMGKRRRQWASRRPAMKGFVKRTFDEDGQIATESAPVWKLNPDATDCASATTNHESSSVAKKPRTSSRTKTKIDETPFVVKSLPFAATKRPRTNIVTASTTQPKLSVQQLCTLHEFLMNADLVLTAKALAKETRLTAHVCTELYRIGTLKTLESLRKHGVKEAQLSRVASADDVLTGASLTGKLSTQIHTSRKRKKEIYENVSQYI